MVGAITSAIIATISAAGYAGIVALMAIESACIPLPSEVVMPFAGYLVSIGRFNLCLVALAGALGCNVGSTLAYAVGYAGGRPFVLRFGGWIWLDVHQLDRAERFFARYGGVTVFIGRLLPLVRTFISLPAGVARMPFLRFQVYSFAGSLPWCFLLAWVGARLGDKWNQDPSFRATIHRFDLAVVAAVVGLAAWHVLRLWRSRLLRIKAPASSYGEANEEE